MKTLGRDGERRSLGWVRSGPDAANTGPRWKPTRRETRADAACDTGKADARTGVRGLRNAWGQGGNAGTDAAAGPAHFRVGVVPLSVRCVDVSAMRDFRALYAPCTLDGPPEDAIRIEVVRTRNGRSLRRRFEVWADGVQRFTVWRRDGVLPHIEWAINWQIALFLPRYFQIHAAVLEVNGEAVVFPADPGSGKTTLAAGLLARGWRYLSDEFALIDPDTLSVHPYPKALCVKEGSFPVLDLLGLGPRRRVYVKGKKGSVTFVAPEEFGPAAVGGPCPVRHILFCRFEPGRRASIRPISRAEAVIRLNRTSFNFLKFHGRGVALLADVTRRARCYELVSGAIDDTCDVVTRAVGG